MVLEKVEKKKEKQVPEYCYLQTGWGRGGARARVPPLDSDVINNDLFKSQAQMGTIETLSSQYFQLENQYFQLENTLT